MGIDGIAMSCDFRYVCYHVFSGYDFYQNPTFVLRNSGKRFDAELETPGRHSHSVDGMTYSKKYNLYFSATNDSAIDQWMAGKKECSQEGVSKTSINSQKWS